MLLPELTPGTGTALQYKQQHCQLLQPFGRSCPAASGDGGAGGGHSYLGNGFSSDRKSQGKNPQPYTAAKTSQLVEEDTWGNHV